MNTILNDVCAMVAAAFALTLVPGFRNLERSLLSRRDQGAVLLVFTILGLVEEATVSHAGLLNPRIVAVCAAGLVAGPLGGTGRRLICHLVSRRAPRPAVRRHHNFHVVRWFDRRVAVPVAP
jgi:LytS/YehU family sensor histidine kinase